jgi:hypothetical protein
MDRKTTRLMKAAICTKTVTVVARVLEPPSRIVHGLA